MELPLFHIFCDYRGVSEELRAPVTQDVLEAFVAALAGAYLKSAIENFLAGVQALAPSPQCKVEFWWSKSANAAESSRQASTHILQEEKRDSLAPLPSWKRCTSSSEQA